MLRTVLTIALFHLTACDSKSGTYDKLCHIYSEFPARADDSTTVVKIYERVQTEIPEILPVYDTVMSNGNDVRYEMLREHARKAQKQENWECDAIKKHWPHEATE